MYYTCQLSAFHVVIFIPHEQDRIRKKKVNEDTMNLESQRGIKVKFVKQIIQIH